MVVSSHSNQLPQFREVIDPLVKQLAERIMQEAMAPGLFYMTQENQDQLLAHVAYQLVDELDSMMATQYGTGDVRWAASCLLGQIDDERYSKEVE
jgi:hypothetical protein